ncbi:hypothetical protein KAX02_02980 [candidate division WOR-3 bacterium]|nr:hypothetical protein [candidate division WOR-3 bacterium]
MNEDQINQNLIQLARKMGKRNASQLLSVLGRDKQFINALDTTVGQELLKHLVDSIENKLVLILQEKDEPQDRSELKAYMGLLAKFQSTINSYNKNKMIFEKGSV